MTIDWIHFTPGMSLAGGVLIGMAAAGFVLVNGRIAGISGILGGILAGLPEAKPQDTSWRLAFISGLVLAPLTYRLFTSLPPAQIDTSWPVLALAGLLTGIGARYGSGCTSGHGVCGISRLSPRSLVATLCFIGTGVVTVFIVRHLVKA
jgi:hypothetical protein